MQIKKKKLTAKMGENPQIKSVEQEFVPGLKTKEQENIPPSISANLKALKVAKTKEQEGNPQMKSKEIADNPQLKTVPQERNDEYLKRIRARLNK